MKKEKAAYTLARLPIGLSFLGHGLVRLPKLNQFVNGMQKGFEATYLPTEIVKPFAFVLPFLELLLGLAILIGFKMKNTTILGVVLVCILIFGSSFQENWSAIAIQMFYGIYLVALYLFSNYNKPLIAKK